MSIPKLLPDEPSSKLGQGETFAHGFDTPDDQFSVLQGSLVQTEAAYFSGERIAGMAKFAVLNSSCGLVPGRTAHPLLLRNLPIWEDEKRANEKLGILLKFSRRYSTLPVRETE